MGYSKALQCDHLVTLATENYCVQHDKMLGVPVWLTQSDLMNSCMQVSKLTFGELWMQVKIAKAAI